MTISSSVDSDAHCRVSVKIEPYLQETLFVKLCERLRPMHAHYLPWLEALGGDSESSLVMALSRDFRMSAWTQDDMHVIRARTLAPQLPRIEFMGLRSTDVRPNYLGWLNYWSAETAAALGFPNPQKDARILPLCRQLSDGAWLVNLTEEPLDLERPEHVEAIVWAYWRFDKVGKRLQPTEKKATPRAKKAAVEAVGPDGLKTFVLRERDAAGRWWESAAEPISAASAEDALRIHFAKMAHGRAPRPKETLEKLRAAYDAIAFEVGLTPAADIDAAEPAP